MDIKTIMTALTEKITGTFQQIQHTISSYLEKEKITVVDLATFIKKDANTLKTSKTLLNLSFNTYHLTKNNLEFVLETKGEAAEKILALTILNKGQTIMKYRSYEENASPYKAFSLPPLTH